MSGRTGGPAPAETAVIVAVPEAEHVVASWRAGWIFGDEVLWLAPEPAESFRRLMAAVWAAFPQCPPYGGVHPDVVPHLTVGDGAPLAELRRAERAVLAMLPIRSRVSRALLIAGSPVAGSWRTLTELPLGRGVRA